MKRSMKQHASRMLQVFMAVAASTCASVRQADAQQLETCFEFPYEVAWMNGAQMLDSLSGAATANYWVGPDEPGGSTPLGPEEQALKGWASIFEYAAGHTNGGRLRNHTVRLCHHRQHSLTKREWNIGVPENMRSCVRRFTGKQYRMATMSSGKCQMGDRGGIQLLPGDFSKICTTFPQTWRLMDHSLQCG